MFKLNFCAWYEFRNCKKMMYNGIVFLLMGGLATSFGSTQSQEVLLYSGAITGFIGLLQLTISFFHLCCYPSLVQASSSYSRSNITIRFCSSCIAQMCCTYSFAFFDHCFSYKMYGLCFQNILALYFMVLFADFARKHTALDSCIFGILFNISILFFNWCVWCRKRNETAPIYNFQNIRNEISINFVVTIQPTNASTPKEMFHCCEASNEEEKHECSNCVCGICLSSMHQQNVTNLQNCIHCFHEECWSEYTTKVNENELKCPLCRANVE